MSPAQGQFSPTAFIDNYLRHQYHVDEARERAERYAARPPRENPDAIRFWPSQASIVLPQPGGLPTRVFGNCHRKSYWALLGEAPSNPVEPKGTRKMLAGGVLEDQESDLAEKAGLKVERQVKFEYQMGPEVLVSGKVDLIVWPPDVMHRVGVEYKSGYGYYFSQQVIGNSKHVGKPKVENVLQVMLYLDALRDIPYFVMPYIDRGEMDWKEHIVSLSAASNMIHRLAIINGMPNQDMNLAAIYRRYRQLAEYVATKTLPDRDYELQYDSAKVDRLHSAGLLSKSKYEKHQQGKVVGDWECAYCPFRAKCWGK